MLQLRPSCENCDRVLPPNATDAMICSFECTFCATCVQGVLMSVCPNCGGNFSPRPIRPQGKLKKYPPSQKRVYKPVDAAKHAAFVAKIRGLSLLRDRTPYGRKLLVCVEFVLPTVANC